MRKIFVIGITGSICTGKSRLCKILESKGIKTIDCDSIGHEVMEEEETKQRIIESFGEVIVNPEGKIDRKQLGAVVFKNEAELMKLNGIMWKRIEEKVKNRINEFESQGEKIVAIEAAMLIKTNWLQWIDTVWVTTVSPQIAVARMIAGRNLTKEECLERIKRQPSSREYARHADILFDTRYNRQTLERTLNREIDLFLTEFNNQNVITN